MRDLLGKKITKGDLVALAIEGSALTMEGARLSIGTVSAVDHTGLMVRVKCNLIRIFDGTRVMVLPEDF